MSLRLLLGRVALLLGAAVLGVTMTAHHWSPTPDLIAVVVGVIALRDGWRSGAAVGLAGGWLIDLLPPGSAVLGATALAYAAAGAVAGRLHRRGSAPSVLVAASVGAVSVAVAAVMVTLALAQSAPVDLWAVGLRAVVTTTVGLVVGPAILALDRALDTRPPQP